MIFSAETRLQNLKRLKSENFDLVIIGGGITGAGTARDAASRGMKVALVEARDFAFGTSSRSSKLVHGGIRYLENLEFGLVFEALTERQLLFEIAPHLVHPLRFLLPLFRGGRVGMTKMGLGMWLYDALSLFDAPELHERLDGYETSRHLPILKRNGLLGSYIYSDAYMDDDRLTIETLRSGHRLGAVQANYVSATGAHFEKEKLSAIDCRDNLTGETFTLKGQHFVSTVGPWTDRVATLLLKNWQRILRPSKGIHITLKRDRLPLKEAVVMAADSEKRIIFAIPRHEMILIGTTDTDYPGDPADVDVKIEDVKYLLKVANEYFPGAELTQDDLLAAYAGVRPLIDDGSSTESQTSREHKIMHDPRNITFVAGGKYTTYRHMAEEIVNGCLDYFRIEDRVRFSKPDTKTPLNPKASQHCIERAHMNIPEYAKNFDISEGDLLELVSRHGLEVEDIARSSQYQGVSQDLWSLEAFHALQQTMCLSLEDFYFRRSRLFLAFSDHGFSRIDSIAEVFGQTLGWSDAKKMEQIQMLKTKIQSELAWKTSLRGGRKDSESPRISL